VFNTGIGIVVLSHWETGRRSGWEYMAEVRRRLSDLTGFGHFRSCGRGSKKYGQTVQFVIAGRATSSSRLGGTSSCQDFGNPNLIDVDHTTRKPSRSSRWSSTGTARRPGVSIEAISRTLESKLGSRRVTTFIEDGEEYDCWWKAREDIPTARRSGEHPGSLGAHRSVDTAVQPGADRGIRGLRILNRYNRIGASPSRLI